MTAARLCLEIHYSCGVGDILESRKHPPVPDGEDEIEDEDALEDRKRKHEYWGRHQ